MVASRLPVGITQMRTLAPVHYGGKQIFFEMSDTGRSNVDGLRSAPEMFVPYSTLTEKSTVTVRFSYSAFCTPHSALRILLKEFILTWRNQ